MNRIDQAAAQQIVETVKEVCGHDVNCISPEGIILASTDPDRIGTFHEAGYRAAAERGTKEVEENDQYDGTKKGINIPFVFHGETVAVIGITGEPQEVRKYANPAVRIMRLLLREKDLEASKELKRVEISYIVRALIHGEELNREYLLSHLKKRNISYEEPCRVVVIRLRLSDRSSNITALEQTAEEVIRELKECLYSYDYPSRYYLVLSERGYQAQKELLKELACAEVQAAAGEPGRISALSRSYQSAVMAMRASKEPFSESETMDLELLFAEAGLRTKQAYTERMLGKLSEKERNVLETYFACDCSLKACAQQLFVHKNTLQYQLKLIGEKTGRDPRRFAEAVKLFLALQLQKYSDPA